MNNTIIFLSLFLIIINVMLVIKINFTFDLYNNLIIIKLYVFNIRIIEIKIMIFGLTYQINNSKKIKKLKLVLSKKEAYIFKQIKSSIIDKLYFDDIIINSDIGVVDASNTVLITQAINLVEFYLSNKILEKNNDTRLYFDNVCNFTSNSIKLDISIKVYFTIFDLIFATLMSFYKGGKYAKRLKRSK